MWVYNMPYSDRFIIESIKALAGREVTVKDIAEHAHVPYGTAKDAISRMEKSDAIERKGKGRRWGHTYTVKEKASANEA